MRVLLTSKMFLLGAGKRAQRHLPLVSGPGFSSQDTLGGSQPSETPVPRTPLWSPWAPGMHVVHIHTCKENIHKHKIKPV